MKVDFLPGFGSQEFSLSVSNEGVLLNLAGCGECATDDEDLDYQILIDHRDLEALEAWIREARGS